jgi:hypothetical protein
VRGDPRDEPFDEIRLRRALRLEATELPSRVDLAAIAAQAEAGRPAFAAASLLSTAVSGLAGAGLIALAAVALPAVAPAVTATLLTTTIEAFARAAGPATAVLDVAQQPSVPLAALAALAVAIAYEYTQRRERARASSS